MSDCSSRGNLHPVIPPLVRRSFSSLLLLIFNLNYAYAIPPLVQEVWGYESYFSYSTHDFSNRSNPRLSFPSSSISIKKQLFCQEEQEIVGHTSVLSTPPDHCVDAVDERIKVALDNHSFLIPAPAHSVYFSHKSPQLLWVLSAPHKL